LPSSKDVERADGTDDGEAGRALREHADAEQRVAAEQVDLPHRRDRLHAQHVSGDRLGVGPRAAAGPDDDVREAAHEVAIGGVLLPRAQRVVDEPAPRRLIRWCAAEPGD